MKKLSVEDVPAEFTIFGDRAKMRGYIPFGDDDFRRCDVHADGVERWGSVCMQGRVQIDWSLGECRFYAVLKYDTGGYKPRDQRRNGYVEMEVYAAGATFEATVRSLESECMKRMSAAARQFGVVGDLRQVARELEPEAAKKMLLAMLK